jgi:hypothetical protein
MIALDEPGAERSPGEESGEREPGPDRHAKAAAVASERGSTETAKDSAKTSSILSAPSASSRHSVSFTWVI